MVWQTSSDAVGCWIWTPIGSLEGLLMRVPVTQVWTVDCGWLTLTCASVWWSFGLPSDTPFSIRSLPPPYQSISPLLLFLANEWVAHPKCWLIAPLSCSALPTRHIVLFLKWNNPSCQTPMPCHGHVIRRMCRLVISLGKWNVFFKNWV